MCYRHNNEFYLVKTIGKKQKMFFHINFICVLCTYLHKIGIKKKRKKINSWRHVNTSSFRTLNFLERITT